MSDDSIVQDKDKKNDNPQDAGGDNKDNFVSKSAYEEVTKDMHKYKANYKELMAKLNESEAKMKAIEEEKLAEQNRWKELAERREQEKLEAMESMKKTQEHYMKSVKMSALIRELGNINAKYLVHADLDSIVVHDDGSLSSESVTQVANKFREENPELVPNDNAGAITDSAPADNNTFRQEKTADLDNMTADQKRELISRAPRSKNNFRRDLKE